MIDLFERKSLMLEHGEIEQSRPRQFCHLLALRGCEPVRPDQLDLLVHEPMHVDGNGLGDRADIDGATAPTNGLQ